MSKFKFKQGLLKVLSPALEEQGYRFIGNHPPYTRVGPSDYLFYEKWLPQIGMACWIGIQLSQHAVPPFSKREFTVFICRGPDVVTAANANISILGTGLVELLHFHFNVPVHFESRGWLEGPPGKAKDAPGPPLYLSAGQWWQFETQEEFEQQLALVLDYLLRYAIPWLEDYRSAMPPRGHFGPPPRE